MSKAEKNYNDAIQKLEKAREDAREAKKAYDRELEAERAEAREQAGDGLTPELVSGIATALQLMKDNKSGLFAEDASASDRRDAETVLRTLHAETTQNGQGDGA